jgi:hypothetical protein
MLLVFDSSLDDDGMLGVWNETDNQIMSSNKRLQSLQIRHIQLPDKR